MGNAPVSLSDQSNAAHPAGFPIMTILWQLPTYPILLSVDFLFFLYAFHAAISIRYWFAIDIAIRYRYRFYPACSIASSDIDSDSERTTTPVAARLRCVLCGRRIFLLFPCFSVPFVDKMARTFLSSPKWRIRPFPPFQGIFFVLLLDPLLLDRFGLGTATALGRNSSVLSSPALFCRGFNMRNVSDRSL